jgi:hypothetical protein
MAEEVNPPVVSQQTVIAQSEQAQQTTPATESQTVIEEPVPLSVSPHDPASNPAATGMRNPFSASAKKIFTADYSKGMENCQLKGIIKLNDRQVALFSVSGKEGKKTGNNSEQLRRVTTGEQITFFANNIEYVFTVRELGSRSAVLIGENDQVYKVWL